MADGSRHSLYVVPESSWGVTPGTPAFDLVRITGTTLGLSRDSLQSEEIRSDRQISDFRGGANQVGGDINFELSYGSFDDLLKAVLMSTDWAAAADTGVSTFDATATGFTRATGDFTADGFEVGQIIVTSGFSTADNNGRFEITAVDATSIDATPLEGQTLASESGDGDEQIVTAHEIVKAGTTRHSFTFMRHFADLPGGSNPYYLYTGVEVNNVQLQISANAMITGTFSVLGKGQETASSAPAGTTYNPESTTSPLDSFSGELKENGNTIAVITEIQLNLENGLETRFVVGSKDSINPSSGRSNCSGTITAYFEDSTLVDKFLNETESSIEFTLPDGAGNKLRVELPRIKYTGGQPDVSGEGPITLSMPFQALLDSTEGTNIILERTPAA